MGGRCLCWFATAFIAAPACARDAPPPNKPTPIAVDTRALLAADARATARHRPSARTRMLAAPGFDLKASPRKTEAVDLDSPHPQDFTTLSATTATGPGFGPILQLDPPADGRRVAAELMVEEPKQRRRGSPLEAMLTFTIDGEDESPPLSVGGGVAGVLWKAIPR